MIHTFFEIASLLIFLLAFSRLFRPGLKGWPPYRYLLAGILLLFIVQTLFTLLTTVSSELLHMITLAYDTVIPFLFMFLVLAFLMEESEQQATYSRNRLRSILDNTEEIICQIDLKGQLVFVNRAAATLSMREVDELLGSDLDDFVHPDDRLRVRRQVLLATGRQERKRFPVRLMSRSGMEHNLEATAIPVYNGNTLDGCQIVAWDVTSVRQAVHQSQFLASMITESTAPILVFNEAGRIIVWNRGMERLTGHRGDQMVGRLYVDFFKQAPDLVLECAMGGGVFSLELTLHTANDNELPALISVYRVQDSPGEGASYAIFLQDLSHQRKLEEQLFQQRRLESMGRLAGGIAHDFKNILTIILGNTMILKKAEDLPERLRSTVEAQLRAIRRGKNLTAQLLSFSKQDKLQPLRLEVAEAIEELETVLEHSGWDRIRLETSIEPHLPPIWADPGRLQQVMMNLCVNARDAMPDGGEISVLAYRRDVLSPEELPRGVKLVPGSYVALEVRDTGQGMDAETLSRIFEPFFSTKGPHEGTGLGLANVHGIVQQHHGWIEVDSQPGLGSQFRIYLPTPETHAQSLQAWNGDEQYAPHEEEGSVVEMPKPRRTGTMMAEHELSAQMMGDETILLLDRDALQSEQIRGLLERHGYKVITALERTEALRKLAQDHRGVDLIIGDSALVGSHNQFMVEIRDLLPPLLILADDTISGEPSLDEMPNCHIMAKPFLPEALVVEVRRLLDAENRKEPLDSSATA